MNAPTELARMIPRLEGRVSAEEWQTRLDLAAAYRLVALFKWDDLVFTHLTARIPGTEHYLINPYGLMFEEMTASSLVKIDIEGKVLQDTPFPINPAGFVIYSAVHAARHDIQSVMHTHTTAGMAVACSQAGLSMSNFYSAQLCDKVAYHDFEGITVHADEGPRLIRAIGDKPAVILRNHGLLAWGDTIPRTFAILWLLNRACEIQLASTSMGAVIPVPEDIQRKSTRDSLQFSERFGAGKDVFDALTRVIDHIDPSYKT